MYIHIVIGNGQRISFLPEVPPEERDVRIGKTVRQVRHTCAISQTFLPGLRFLHIVTHVHLCKVSADTDPAGVIITRGNMIAFCFNTSIVAVRAV